MIILFIISFSALIDNIGVLISFLGFIIAFVVAYFGISRDVKNKFKSEIESNSRRDNDIKSMQKSLAEHKSEVNKRFDDMKEDRSSCMNKQRENFIRILGEIEKSNNKLGESIGKLADNVREDITELRNQVLELHKTKNK